MIYSGFNGLSDMTKRFDKIASYSDKYQCKYKIEKCTSIVGKNIKLFIDCSKSDHRKDIVLNQMDYVRIAGAVLSDDCKKVGGIYVTLYRFDLINYKTEYTAIADTISDENGFFQFIIPNSSGEDNFKVKVSDCNNE